MYWLPAGPVKFLQIMSVPLSTVGGRGEEKRGEIWLPKPERWVWLLEGTTWQKDYLLVALILYRVPMCHPLEISVPSNDVHLTSGMKLQTSFLLKPPYWAIYVIYRIFLSWDCCIWLTGTNPLGLTLVIDFMKGTHSQRLVHKPTSLHETCP